MATSVLTSIQSSEPVVLRAHADGPACSVLIGLATRTVPDKLNEDFCGVAAPSDADGAEKGMMIAVADGVSAGGAGRLAAETVAHCLLNDYYATAPGKPIALVLEQLLRATNAWMYSQNRARADDQIMLSTASALLLRGRRFQIAHVGDTRIYRVRSRGVCKGGMPFGAFEQLTADHTWPGHSMHGTLKRAIGLDSHLVIDFVDGECDPSDAFLVVSDGVWETLGEAKMKSLFRSAANPQTAADALVAAASELQASYLGRNDASAIVVSVLPPPR